MAVCGTIPYLGTFLTDLTMVDTAMDDRVEGGLINFDKRRKEFEILAQIKLLQSSAQLYDLKADTAFIEWFFHIRTYDDKERWADVDALAVVVCAAYMSSTHTHMHPCIHARTHIHNLNMHTYIHTIYIYVYIYIYIYIYTVYVYSIPFQSNTISKKHSATLKLLPEDSSYIYIHSSVWMNVNI